MKWYERSSLRLIHRREVRTKYDIYVLIVAYELDTYIHDIIRLYPAQLFIVLAVSCFIG